MAEFWEVLQGRRSIRNHIVGKDVPEQMLEKVLEAVRWTPSWANTQCWEIVVVKDPEMKLRLQRIVGRTNPAYRAMVEAPIVLALCAKLRASGFSKNQSTTKFGDWFMFDLGLAAQSLCLAAHEQGLGTVIVGLFDHDEVKKALAIPDQHEIVAMIPLGFPARGTGVPKRREVSEFTHREKFGSQP